MLLAAAVVAAAVLPARSQDLQQTPRTDCFVENKGYSDPSVPILNGGLVSSAQDCQDKCVADPNCLGFTFYRISFGCWIQGISGTLPALEDIDNVISGPKVCPAPTPAPTDAVSGGLLPGWVPAAAETAEEVTEEAAETAEEVTEETAESVLEGVEGGGSGNGTNESNESLLAEAEEDIEEIEEVVQENGGFPLWIAVALLIGVGLLYVVNGGSVKSTKRRDGRGKDRDHESLDSESDSDSDSEKEDEIPKQLTRGNTLTRQGTGQSRFPARFNRRQSKQLMTETDTGASGKSGRAGRRSSSPF